MVGAPTATDGNYIFVGWAYKAGENSYIFEGETVNYNVYYAIWAYKRAEIQSLTVSNLTLNATVNTNQAHSVYGWYADEQFSGNPLAICNGNSVQLTAVTSTIVYARMHYNMTITVSGNCRDVYIKAATKVEGIPVNEKDAEKTGWPAGDRNVSVQIPVLEGVQVRIRNADANKKAFYVQALYNGNYVDITGMIYILVSSGFAGMGTSEAELYAYDGNDKAIAVNEKIDGSNDAFSTNFEVRGNLAFTVSNENK